MRRGRGPLLEPRQGVVSWIVPAIALGLATACTLDETGIGSTSDGDSDTDTDTGTGTDSDTGTGTESDTRTGTGSETDAPDRDLDGLPDENDPCVSAPNVLLSDGFAGWEGLTGEWDFAVDGATGTQAGGIGYAWDGGCPGAACLPDYFVDVVARIDAGAPVFGVLGSLQWPATEDHYCEVLPGDPWRMVLTGEPGAPDSDATDLVPAPGGAFAMRLIVRGDEQACRGHRVTDAVVRTTNPDRPAGGVGVYVFDGTMTFESVRVRSIPAACSPVAVNPPAP